MPKPRPYISIAAFLTAAIITLMLGGCFGTSSNSANSGAAAGNIDIFLSADKSDILLNTQETVLFTAEVKNASPAEVSLTDNTGVPAATMLDDGNSPDQTAGDGIYTAALTLSSDEIKNLDYYAKFDIYISNPESICFYREITEEEWNNFDSDQSYVSSLIEQSNKDDKLLNDIADYLNNQGYYKNVNINGDTITATTKFGVTGFYAIRRDEDTKGSLSNTSFYDVNTLLTTVDAYAATSDTLNSILVVRPFASNADFDYTTYLDCANNISEHYNNKTKVTVVTDKNVTVDFMKTWDNYDAVFYDSHGTLANSLSTAYAFLDSNNGNPYLITGEYYGIVRSLTSSDYESGRIIVDFGGGRAAVGYKFFDQYYSSNDFKDTFIYMGSCYSMYNSTIAKTLIKKGAAAVLGWSDTVSFSYDRTMLKTVIEQMLNGENVRDAMLVAQMEHGYSDPKNSQTHICIYGRWEYTFPGFEEHASKLKNKGLFVAKVINGNNQMSIPGAKLELTDTHGTVGSAQSVEHGHLDVALAAGNYTARLTAEGFEPHTFDVIITQGSTSDYGEIFLYPALTDFYIPATLEIPSGTTTLMDVEYVPSDADHSNVTWSSDDPSIVTALEQGMLTGHRDGTTTVRARAEINSQTVERTCEVTVKNSSRDCVLVLDLSGSMDGTPKRELKEAATSFCEYITRENGSNRVGIIVFGDNVKKYSLTSDIDTLKNTIDNAYDGGMTHMGQAMLAVDEVFAESNNPTAIKNVIIMADGLPNDSNIDPEAVGEDLKQRYNVYTLGFYHKKFSAEQESLLKNIQNQGYYSVEDGSNLMFVFGDIAEDIDNGSKILISIACPVEVTVNHNNQTLDSSDINKFNTDFGSINTFGQNNDIKLLTLDEGNDYDISIAATGAGTMDYSMMHYNEDNSLTDIRSFKNITVTNTSRFYTSTAVTDDSKFLIDNDGDGLYENTLYCKNAETAEAAPIAAAPQNTVSKRGIGTVEAVIIIIALAFMVVMILAFVIYFLFGNKPKPQAPPPRPANDNNNVQRPVYNAPQRGLLYVNSGPLSGSSIAVSHGEKVVIGRDPASCGLVLDQGYDFISRKHCTVTYDASNKSYLVTDHNSTNGTFVGTQKISSGATTIVPAGGSICLGKNSCEILLK